jgi:hypothetical protein
MYAFASRCFANHSAENPDGIFTESTLLPFFGVDKDSQTGALKARPRGWEQIPDNW